MKKLESSWLACRPIAHRGLHDENFPENSLPAFLAAIENNYPIELDVQLSYDDVIVVFHDYNTKRMTGVSRRVSDIKSSELTTFKLEKTDYCIPTFEQVLRVVNGRVPLLIEIKNEGKAGCLEEKLCRRMKRYNGEFAIQSFNPFSIISVKRQCPEFITGQLSKSFRNKLKNYMHFISRPDFIAYRIDDMPSKLIKVAKSRGQVICCWTVASEEEQCKAIKYCSNYIFEHLSPKRKYKMRNLYKKKLDNR